MAVPTLEEAAIEIRKQESQITNLREALEFLERYGNTERIRELSGELLAELTAKDTRSDGGMSDRVFISVQRGPTNVVNA